MINSLISLYSWASGVVMIVIFAVVCASLVGILINFMLKGKSNGAPDNTNKNDNLDS